MHSPEPIFQSNPILALRNIMKNESCDLSTLASSSNSANAEGDALEYFVKDMFDPEFKAISRSSKGSKKKEYARYLSWDGNTSNFPDFFVRGGVGVETKKVSAANASSIALNSSYPKISVTPTTQNVIKDISKIDEVWEEKQIVYAVGYVPTPAKRVDPDVNRVMSLWFFYGNTVFPPEAWYQFTIKQVRKALNESSLKMKADSKEVARLIDIDPGKHTDMRIRGMYDIDHPQRMFAGHYEDTTATFPKDSSQVFLVIRKSDYDALGEQVDLSDPHYDLTPFIEKGTLVQKLVQLPAPEIGEIISYKTGKIFEPRTIECYIFIGYTDA